MGLTNDYSVWPNQYGILQCWRWLGKVYCVEWMKEEEEEEEEEDEQYHTQ